MYEAPWKIGPLLDRLTRARNFFSVDEEDRDVLVIMFNCLETELWVRSSFDDAVHYSGSKARTLAGFFLYTTQRFEELLVQLAQLEWMKEKFISGQNRERGLWHLFAALAVKSFYVGVVSLMDSLAPLAISIRDSLSTDEHARLPELPRALKKHRTRIPAAVIDCLESAKGWHDAAREVRNILVHRQHHQIIIGGPEEGPIFQVQERRGGPRILLPLATWRPDRQEHELVDFNLYAAWIVAELLVLLDDLGATIASELGVTGDISDRARRRGDFRVFRSALDRLIDRADALSQKEVSI